MPIELIAAGDFATIIDGAETLTLKRRESAVTGRPEIRRRKRST